MKLFIVLCTFAVTVISAERPRFRSARFRFQRQELAPSTTGEPTTESSGDGPYPPVESGPYAPSGWKPSGQSFSLPNEQPAANQQTAPSDSYGAPAEQSAPYAPSGWKPSGEAFTLPNEQPAAKQEAAPSDSYGAPSESAPYAPSGWKPSGQAFTLPARQEAQSPPATSYGIPDNIYGPPNNEYGTPSTEKADVSTTEAATDNPQSGKLEVEVPRSEGTYYLLLPNGQLQKVEFVAEADPRKMAYSAQLRYPVSNQAPLSVFNP